MDDLLQQGVTAYSAGKRDEARKFFIAAIKQNQNDERAWGWMYNVANNDQERIHCLKQILRNNPKNEKANELLNELSGFNPPLERPQIVTSEKQSQRVVTAQQSKQPEKTTWYRSQTAYLLFFLFVTPLWAVLIFTDKKQNTGVKILASIIGVSYLFFCCLALTLSSIYSTSLISTSTPSPPTRTPPPPTATIDPEKAKARWSTVDIRALVKNPDKYIGYELHYQGEVFSIEENSQGAAMQVWVNIPGGSDFDREAVIVYWPGRTDSIYEGTTIEFWGYGLGSLEGTNAFGGTVRQPLIQAEYLTYFR